MVNYTLLETMTTVIVCSFTAVCCTGGVTSQDAAWCAHAHTHTHTQSFKSKFDLNAVSKNAIRSERLVIGATCISMMYLLLRLIAVTVVFVV
jgi:hypothetical protein